MPPTPRGLCVFFFAKTRASRPRFFRRRQKIGETTKDDVSHDDDDDDESERRGDVAREKIVEDIKRKIEENKMKSNAEKR